MKNDVNGWDAQLQNDPDTPVKITADGSDSLTTARCLNTLVSRSSSGHRETHCGGYSPIESFESSLLYSNKPE